MFAALGGNSPRARAGEKGGDASTKNNIFQQCSGCRRAENGEGKPGASLKGIFKRDKLRKGKPATEKNVRERIQKGGDGIPSFADILSDKETDRLIAYLKTL